MRPFSRVLSRAAREAGDGRTRSPAVAGRLPEAEARLPGRALGCLYLAGATIGLVSLLLPLPRQADLPGLYSNVALAYAGGALLVAGARWTKPAILHLALALGAILIARAIVLSGESVSFYSVWFIWVGVYAFSFFDWRAALAHMAFVAALYGATLVHDPPSSPIARWLTTVSTLVVAGAFIATLVQRIRRQAHAAEMTAVSMVEVTDLAHELAATRDGSAARRALIEGARRVARAQSCELWELVRDGQTLRLTAGAGVSPTSAEIEVQGGRGEVAAAFSTGAATTFLAAGPTGTAVARPGWAELSRLAQPVSHESSVVAVLQLGWADPAALRDPATQTLVRLLAVEAAVTLRRIELLSALESVARTDELTGLPNRRAWNERLPLELARASRTNESLSVAMIDLDYFKRYNDEYGHQAGDRLLREIASFWNDELRETDLLVRFGGEEFALAFPACSAPQALAVIERFRSALPDGQTFSAGLARWDGLEEVDELVNRADQALYHAKRTGRNRSVLAAAPLPRRDDATAPARDTADSSLTP